MTLRPRRGPTPAWWTLLNKAVSIIERERQGLFDSCKNLSGPYKGKVTDHYARGWLREYDRFLKAARAELVKRHKA